MRSHHLALVLLVALSACDDASSPPNDVVEAEASAPCERNGFTLVTQEASLDKEGNAAYMGGNYDDDMLRIEVYAGSPALGVGTHPIGASGAEQSYATCTLCVFAGVGCAGSSCTTYYFAQAGELEITSDFASGRLVGRLRDLELLESTMDFSGASSTPVPDGERWCIASSPIDVEVSLVNCSSDADCAATPATAKCHPEQRRCVECVVNDDCRTAPLLRCDETASLCAE